LASAHHRLIHRLAITEDLSDGAAVSVGGLGLERNHRANRGQGLQLLPGSHAVGLLRRLRCINARQTDRDPLGAIAHSDGVTITHRKDRRSPGRAGQQQDQGEGNSADH
jgi:hypothetical protein